LDCQPALVCPPEVHPAPDINYLAKDYQSLRQLILDRLALTMPDWNEAHVPDIGITLVELLAYAGDYLSYYQDAVATEAYLDTARLRISARRHARLVDYRMHEGCNARAWVTIATDTDETFSAGSFYFITGFPQLPAGGVLTGSDLEPFPQSYYEVFEPVLPAARREVSVYAANSEIHFHTWGDNECCLPAGATRATLIDPRPRAPANGTGGIPPGDVATGPGAAVAHSSAGASRRISPSAPTRAVADLAQPPPILAPGDVLIFEEVLGPTTGNPADADPIHRCAVSANARGVQCRCTHRRSAVARDRMGSRRCARVLTVHLQSPACT
jgi:predicted phage baseplate assembly protein